MKNITKLAIKYHINAHKEFLDFCDKTLPSVKKYPLLFQVLQSTANNYFEQLFKVNHNYYPMIKSCKSSRDQQSKYGILYKQLKLIDSLIISSAKLIIYSLIKLKLINLKFKRCSSISNKKNYPKELFSSEIDLSLDFFSLHISHKISKDSKFHQLIRKMINTTISPLTIIMLFIIIIPLKINFDNMQKIKSFNRIILSLTEFFLKLDLLFSKDFIKQFRISEFITTGWFSANGSIIFNILNKLNIQSFVIAHGHLSSSTLAYFYPIISDSILVLTEEENIRLKNVNNKLFNQKKKIESLFNYSDISKYNIKTLKIKMPKIKNIIFGFSGAYIFATERYYEIYKELVCELSKREYSILFRPHLQDNLHQRQLLSLGGKLESFTSPLEEIDKENSMIVGANTTLLIETNNLGILTVQISDFSTCIANTIKSILTLTSEEFLISCK